MLDEYVVEGTIPANRIEHSTKITAVRHKTRTLSNKSQRGDDTGLKVLDQATQRSQHNKKFHFRISTFETQLTTDIITINLTFRMQPRSTPEARMVVSLKVMESRTYEQYEQLQCTHGRLIESHERCRVVAKYMTNLLRFMQEAAPGINHPITVAILNYLSLSVALYEAPLAQLEDVMFGLVQCMREMRQLSE